MDFDKLKQLLKLNEGVRNTVYFCTEGFATIGVGHNLDAKPISDEAIEQILDDDLKDCIRDVSTLAVWEGLDEVRQAVLIDMCFNLVMSLVRPQRFMVVRGRHKPAASTTHGRRQDLGSAIYHPR